MEPNFSILDHIGGDVVGVISPVSICMAVVVFLLSVLSSPSNPNTSPPPITAATLVYLESPNDSPSQKLLGALADAAVFVALVAAVTFLLVLLYYYHFTRCLQNYMRFSAFFVLFSMGGGLLVAVLARLSVPLDAPTALLLLFDAAAVGVLAVFSPALPILLRQAYMVALAVVVAAWLSRLPEWTTWILLLALAAYDLVAVLAPRGPLRMLVELASSRDDDLPALVYESRPAVAPAAASSGAVGSVELQPVAMLDANVTRESGSGRTGGAVIEMENLELDTSLPGRGRREGIAENASSEHAVVEIERVEGETAPLVSRASASSDGSSPPSPPPGLEMFEATRGIKLGLGDFVFYSVLVGKAAMYDLMTVYACYLAIVAGLGCTLILLAVCRHALPALPISITLGVGFYFLTRLLMEPFVVGASTNLVMF